MAPNRKTDLSSQDFASLDVSLFQTIKVAGVPQHQHQQPQQQTPQQPSNISYWDWPADDNETTLDQLQYLNAHHIESNLLQEAERLQAKQEHETVLRSSLPLPDSESYWDMPTTTATVDAVATLLVDAKPLRATSPTATTSRPRHHPAPTGADYMTNYWDDVSSDDYWNDPSHTHYNYKSSKQVTTRHAVPTHHAAPTDLDRDSYWNESPATTAATASDAYWTDPAESHNKLDYWDWPSFQSKREEKENVLQQEALEEECVHRLTNAAFIERQLLAQAARSCQQQQQQQAAVVLVAANDDYWAC